MITTLRTRYTTWGAQVPTDPATLLDVVADLLSPAPPAKDDSPLWSPTTFVGPRSNANAVEVAALVLDYDDGTPLDVALAPWAGVAVLAHSSWSHTTTTPKYRIVLPLAAPVPAASWSRVWWWARQRAAGEPDPACKDPARAYYVPLLRPGAWLLGRPGDSLVVPALETLPLPPTDRRAPPGWTPPAPTHVHPAVLARAVRRWRERLAHAEDTIGRLTTGRRGAIQRWTYLLAGHLWLDPTLVDELVDGMRRAAIACRRDNANSEALVHDTTSAGMSDPIPVDDLVGDAEARTLDPERPQPPLVVKYRAGYWVRVDAPDAPGDPASGIRWDGSGRYAGPTDARGMLPSLRDRGDVRPWDVRADKIVPWSADTILLRYGANAAGAELVYPGPDGRVERPWDDRTRTIRTTRATRVPVRPVRHERVERWLGALLGDGPLGTAALRWLATVDVLDRPSAALYLEGPPGVGKGLLAQALAARWGTAPVPLEVALGPYPIPLASCPIVHLDEGTALDATGTARFRTLVSERSHPALNEKYLPPLSLAAAVRVLITANNGDALGIREVRSLEDLEAIVERVLHVPVAGAAREHLADTTGWVHRADGAPGAVPEHLAWLALTLGPTVQGAGRWVVPGVRTGWHDALLWHVPEYAAVLGGVLVGLAGGAFVRVAGGVVVSAVTLHRRWASLVLEDRARPTQQALLRTLSALGTPGLSGTWVVDERALGAYARAIGDTLPPWEGESGQPVTDAAPEAGVRGPREGR